MDGLDPEQTTALINAYNTDAKDTPDLKSCVASSIRMDDVQSKSH